MRQKDFLDISQIVGYNYAFIAFRVDEFIFKLKTIMCLDALFHPVEIIHYTSDKLCPFCQTEDLW